MTFAQFVADSTAFGAICVMGSIVVGLLMSLIIERETVNPETARIEKEVAEIALRLADERHAQVLAAIAADKKGE